MDLQHRKHTYEVFSTEYWGFFLLFLVNLGLLTRAQVF